MAQENEPARWNRRSTRLSCHDYTAPGFYFVTICIRSQQCLFGEVQEARVVLNSLGRLVESCWDEIPVHFPQVSLDERVVMPNHLHGILELLPTAEVGSSRLPAGPSSALVSGSLGAVVRSFKAAATRGANLLRGTARQTFWQRNFHDRVIRDEAGLQQIRQYIRDNPLRWDLDPENPHGLSKRGRLKGS